MYMYTKNIPTVLNKTLTTTIGRARRRTLDLGDLEQVLREAHRDGWGARDGGHVSANYGYPAHTLCSYAARTSRGHYRVWIAWCPAVEGAARMPIYRARAIKRGHAEAWADQASECLLLSSRAVHAWLAALDEQAAPARRVASEPVDTLLRDHGDRLVTVADSLAAGNCAQVTHVTSREPSLLRYALAACQRAVIRVTCPPAAQ